MVIAQEIPSVNYHLWKPCNMRCGFCFATFLDIQPDILPKGHLARRDCLLVVEALARTGFQKINFAGGEPTLCPWLPDLIRRARELGFTTSIVTNGSRITAEWLESVNGSLDWMAISIDSVNPGTLSRVGRTTISGPMSQQDYLAIIGLARQHDVRVKINTVVARANFEEDLSDFIIRAGPERWKLLQALPVRGQNDLEIGAHVVSAEEFDRYVHSCLRVQAEGIAVVPESNELMTGSYVMVDPAGRFFDNVTGGHTYSRPIMEVGAEAALRDVTVKAENFLARSGLYDW